MKIYGGTGPLVYGAGHVYVYNALYGVTGGGGDVGKAQGVFWGVYLVGLGVVMGCYRRAKVCIYRLLLVWWMHGMEGDREDVWLMKDSC